MANILFLLSILILEGFCEDFDKRCLLLGKKCVDHCPRNMHPYHTRCDMDTISQRTCEEPYVYTIGYTCGWSRCDCNGELMLEESTLSCVDFLTCSHENPKKSKGRRRKGLFRMSKKIRLPEMEEFPAK